jgi:hypothetical protein
MITEFKDEEILYSVNTWTGYPKICDITDETFKRMVELLDFVENSKNDVMPSNAFWMMKHLIAEGSFNCRGAHAFRFWFSDKNAAEAFYNLYGGNLESPPILPTRRVN